MNIICNFVKSSNLPTKPLIFGMTASPILSKIVGSEKNENIIESMQTLQDNTNCVIQSSQELLDSLEYVFPKPPISLLKYIPDIYQTTKVNSIGDGLSIIAAITNGNFTNVKSLFNYTELSYDKDPVHILIHSFLRVRHAEYVFHILKLKKNFQLNSTTIYTLTQEKPGERGIIFPINMNLEDKDYINLNDLQGMLGQVCIVTLECGILCGINSLKIVSKSIDSIDQKFSQQYLNEMGESIVDVASLMSLRYIDESRRSNKSHSDESKSKKCDPDRIKQMAKELHEGLFEIVELSELENTVRSSLLDIFIALIHCCYNSELYGRELLGIAVKTICKKLHVWTQNRIAIITIRIEEYSDLRTDIKIESFDSNIETEVVESKSETSKKNRYYVNTAEERERHETFINELEILKQKESILSKLIDRPFDEKHFDILWGKLLLETVQYFSISLGFVTFILLCGVHRSILDVEHFKFNIGSCDTFENFFQLYKTFSENEELSPPSIRFFQFSIYDACSAILESVDSFKYLIDLNDEDTNAIHLEALEVLEESKSNINNDIKLDSIKSTSSSSCTESTIKIKMISNKLLCLFIVWSLIESDMDPNSDDSEVYDFFSIIFCKMRLTAQIICNVMDLFAKIAIKSEIQNSWFCPPTLMKISKCRKLKPCCMLGNTKTVEQVKVLTDFSEKNFNILCATDVAEEGLDIRVCKLVVNFDIPDTTKSFIQRRGRARATDSKIVFLLPEGAIGSKDLEHLQSIQNQESLMNCYSELITDALNTSDNSTTTNRNGDGNHVTVLDSNSNSHGNSHHHKLEQTSKMSEEKTDNSKSDDITVDLTTSSHLLLQYCQQLPSNEFFKPQPLFYLEEVSKLPRLYSCSVLLPTAVPASIRCVKGPAASSKREAKALVALMCLENLKKHGELNNNNTGGWDPLRRLKNRKLKHSPVDEVKHTPVSEQINESSRNKDNDILSIVIKSVPEILSASNSTSNPSKLHFYAVRAYSSTPSSKDRVSNCYSCNFHLKGLNAVGLALLAPIPQDVLDIHSNGTLRTREELSIRFEYLGPKDISEEDLFQMQRFHKGIICWESEDHPFHMKMDYINIFSYNEKDLQNESDAKPIDPKIWTKSSNSSYYIFFPLPPTVNLSPTSYEESQITPIDRDFVYSSEWSPYLKKCANEAQILTHNLRVQRHEVNHKAKEGYSEAEPIPETSKYCNDQFPDMIIGRGRFDLFMGVQTQFPMKLSDVARLVRRSSLVTAGVISPEYEFEGNRQMFDCLRNLIKENKFSPDKNNDLDNNTETNNEDDALLPMTFATSLLQNNPNWVDDLNRLVNKPDHTLIPVVFVPPKLTLTQIFSPTDERVEKSFKVTSNDDSNSDKECCESNHHSHPVLKYKRHSHVSLNYLVPECCDVIGPAVWFFAGLTSPSVSYRLQSLLLAFEARELVVDSVKNYYENVDHDCSPELSEVGIPSPMLMLQTLTPRLSNESLDYERLEMIGDSLLKLVITVELFRMYPHKHEGFLTERRSKLVSNQHLREVSETLDLSKYLRACRLSVGRQGLMIRPAGMSFKSFKKGLSLWNQNIVPYSQEQIKSKDFAKLHSTDEINKMKRFYNPSDNDCKVLHELLKRDSSEIEELADDEFFKLEYVKPLHCMRPVRSKIISDSIEAIIAGFYIAGGLRSVINVIKGLGSWPQLESNVDDEAEVSNVIEPIDKLISDNTMNANSKNVSGCSDEDKSMSLEVLTVEHHELYVPKLVPPKVIIPPNYPEHLEVLALGHAINNNDNNSSSKKESDTKITPDRNYNPHLDRYDDHAASRLVNCSSELLLQIIEDTVGYRFKDFQVLDEALTHSSITYKQSNQRLEFLGDAIIDFTVVSAVFNGDIEGNWSQGELTMKKIESSNNKNLSRVTCKLRLYRYLNMAFPQLHEYYNEIDNWYNNQLSIQKKSYDEKKSQLQNQIDIENVDYNPNEIDDIVLTAYINNMKSSVMKTLADTLEAIIGAVYIDSEGSLETISKCLKHMKII